ncbi:sugar phosphate isomerase/epimerase family protein (plasmid) [Agrobacterium sp. rho-13.3]|uniref:sugar phosphate isomerase/epimerase family protein n=1 Tax=Agrobacterium sp. rho-13.3 TaxID=3072980 RepID=UPI002A159EBA|nr:TIM barrel protein [Agrobacterium sp. rho-13.3]MDX8312035.1 TIM barrel protein [Agrobacterium sp. rho-13.3]
MAERSLHHLTMINKHPVQIAEAAAAGGFSHCGIRLVAPRAGDPLIDILKEPGGIVALGDRLTSLGIGLLDIEAVWLSETTNVADLYPAFEAGQRLGARYLLAVGNDPEPNRQHENFQALCEAAELYDLKVGLEFISYCQINSLQKAADVVVKSGRSNAGLIIDSLQFFRSGMTPSDLTPEIAARVLYAQICDARLEAPATIDEKRFEAREDRLLPGDGELPIRELMAALPPYIPMSLEAPTQTLKGASHFEVGTIAGAKMHAFLNSVGR